MSFEKDLENLINSHSLENESNTPDFIMAAFLVETLRRLNIAIKARDNWYGLNPEPGEERCPHCGKTEKGEEG